MGVSESKNHCHCESRLRRDAFRRYDAAILWYAIMYDLNFLSPGHAAAWCPEVRGESVIARHVMDVTKQSST